MASKDPAWTEYKTDDGAAYYHNLVTGVTQWERPIDFATAPASVPQAGGGSLSLSSFGDTSSNPFDVPSTVSLAGTMDSSKEGRAKDSGSLLSMEVSNASGDSQRVALSSSSGQSRQLGSGSGIPFIGNMKWCYCFDIIFLQSFFNINTADVLQRCTVALLPFKSANFFDFQTNADFYGPFWIATTIIVFIFASFNSSVFVDTSALVNYSVMVKAAGLIYGFLLVVPLICGCILYFVKPSTQLPQQDVEEGEADRPLGEHSMGLRQLICVYGYSLFPLLPVCFLCLLHLFGQDLVFVNVVEWIVVLSGMALCVWFTLVNMYRQLAAVPISSYRYAILCVMLGSQVFLFLFYKFYFLASYPKIDENTSSNPDNK
eukprot:GHVS01065319.1.p1 GENE.GHVS01065319.1~~GHVS01065319.1.p1  ORF type:complete len:373 (+),score=42.95 GHVS01065319.1:206-1324(+)